VNREPPAAAHEPDLIFRRPWVFVTSVPSLETLPPADRAEIAFAGRSNVGKSSLINAVVGQSGLARASNTPGRTQQLNYFRPEHDARVYLVDMPGYGYAEAPKSLVEDWTRLVKDYLRGRQTLRRVFLLIDARHGLKANDREIMELLDEAAMSYQIVLTKIDKISPQAASQAVQAVRQALERGFPAAFPEIIATSSDSGDGIDAVQHALLVAAGIAEPAT
jgi:GTP-binding protein